MAVSDSYGAPYSPPIGSYQPPSNRNPKYQDSYGAPLSPPLNSYGAAPVSDSYGSPINSYTIPPTSPQISDNSDPSWNQYNPIVDVKTPSNTPYNPPFFPTTQTPILFPTPAPRLPSYPPTTSESDPCCALLRVRLGGECLTHQPGRLPKKDRYKMTF